MTISRYAIGCLCGAMGLLSVGPSLAATARQGTTGETIAVEAIDGAIRHGAVLITLDSGENLSALGFTAQAAEPSQVHVSASSEFLILAVSSGKVRMNGRTARAGEALVTGFAGAKTLSTAFDARRLAGTASPAIATEVASALAPVIKRRKTAAFFGVYEPTGVNAASPGNPLAEPVRRDILLDPAVIAVRAKAGTNRADVKAAVASGFVTAVANQDSATAAGLLDPMPFLSAGRDWAQTRRAYAGANIASWNAQGALQVTGIDGDTADVETGGHKGKLTLIEREGTYFVAGLEVLP